jgi:hypothetical protein
VADHVLMGFGSMIDRLQEETADSLAAYQTAVALALVAEISRALPDGAVIRAPTLPAGFAGPLPIFTAADNTALRALQRVYVCTKADKAENNMVLICKRYYCELIRRDLEPPAAQAPAHVPPAALPAAGPFPAGGPPLPILPPAAAGPAPALPPVYEVVQHDVAHIAADHQQFLQHLRLRPAADALPHYYITAKLHKTPFAFRYISGASNVTTTPINRKLSLFFRGIGSDVPILWDLAARHIPGYPSTYPCS